MIISGFIDNASIKEVLSDFLFDKFGIKHERSKSQLAPLLKIFKEDLLYYIEYPYVEKYYRDSYYSFYSKKHNSYERNSIRLSLFSNLINPSAFFSNDYYETVQQNFFGYITIRPTTHSIIGHSLISPLALKKNDFVLCLCSETVLVNGLKFKLHGFPYLTQDNETITCSETALINITNYFGNKYAEYSIILPSQINRILNLHSYQRQLPSSGLPSENISFVLKKVGFGTKVYALDKDTYNKENFREIFYAYIESGIPIIATLSSKEKYHHAVVVIGRENISGQVNGKRDFFSSFFGSKIYSFDSFLSDILVMNGNHPPYELINFDKPLLDNDGDFYNIKSFIVPLYSKVNVEAYQFKNLFLKIVRILKEIDLEYRLEIIPSDHDCIVRYFLASSKSYKNYLARSPRLSVELKTLITGKSMPKFIWVGEIIDGKSLNPEQEVRSIVVIDATESGLQGHLIYAKDCNKLILYDPDLKKNGDEKRFPAINVVDEIFYTFADNLKGAHTQWKN
jgi:hypothetical protein